MAVILAGGRGQRMGMLCEVRPKPVLSFGGRVRVIDFSLSNCVHSGIDRLAVLTDYRRSDIRQYLEQWSKSCRGGTRVDVVEPQNGSYNGTADAVFQNLDYLCARGPGIVVVLAADHVYRMDYRKMVAFHESVGADVTVGVVPVPVEEAHRFGIAVTDAARRVREFQEKPAMPRTNLASMGIYVFNWEVLRNRLIEDAAEPLSLHDIGHAIMPRVVKRDAVFAYGFDGYWQDVGTVESYYEANMRLLCDGAMFAPGNSWPILSGEVGAAPSRVWPDARVKNSLIGPGCAIHGRVENSVLAARVRVEEHAVVRNSVVLGGTFVGKYSVVDGCLLDEDVRVAAFCYVGYGNGCGRASQEEMPRTAGALTVVGKSAVIPPHVAIGRGSSVRPNSGPAEFNAGSVPPGTVVETPVGQGAVAQAA